MAQISRRDFLKLLPLLPFIRVIWPQVVTDAAQSRQEPAKPNILVVIFDTLSAKHMSLYGYSRETTPNLARFADRATVFHHHYASGNFTTPGTASILTGTYPWSHRAFNMRGMVKESLAERNVFRLLPDNYYKIAYTHNLLAFSLLHQFRGGINHLKKTRELCLRDAQYADQLFYNDYNVAIASENPLLERQDKPSSLFLSIAQRARLIVDRSSDESEYGHLFPRGVPHIHTLSFILEHAIDWIGEQVTSWPRPFFAYFHLLPPHSPYFTRRDFIDVFKDGWTPETKPEHVFSDGRTPGFLNQQRREYDEYLAYTDAEFGRLFDALERSGQLDNTYLVVTSDHGELFERGIRGHVTEALYDPLLHVPLLIARPGKRQREDVFSYTSAVDLLPTFMHISGQEIPEWVEGQVLPTFDSSNSVSDRPIFALEAKANAADAPLSIGTAAVIKDQQKLIHYFGYDKLSDNFELYDLSADPEELGDLYGAKGDLSAELEQLLTEQLARVNQVYLSR